MNILRTLFVAFIALLFASCEHKDLCYHHPHSVKIIVKFDWSKAPDANPAGMCVFFYPESGGEARRFDFSGRNGGQIEINIGKYRAIAYNNDTEAVRYANGSFENHRLYTREGQLLEPMEIAGDFRPTLPEEAQGNRVVITADQVWGASAEMIEITMDGTYYDHETITGDMSGPQLKVDNTGEIVEITFTPEDVVCHYSYEYINVKHLSSRHKLSAALTGMAGVYYPGMWELHTDRVTLPFEARSDKNSRIVGDFLTFGHHNKNAQPHRMVLYVVSADADGKPIAKAFTTDVTDQVHGAENPRRVHIVISDTINLPVPIEGGSGFAPTVDDWDVVEEDIIM